MTNQRLELKDTFAILPESVPWSPRMSSHLVSPVLVQVQPENGDNQNGDKKNLWQI